MVGNASGHGLVTGFARALNGADFSRMKQAGAGIVRVPVAWSSVGPHRPAEPANPADPSYRFGGLDDAVRTASADGLRVLITFSSAPRWAEGRHRPRGAPAGSWKPNPKALGHFAHALAARYSGSFTPLGSLSPLPRVRDLQVWNEPNLRKYLTPQWRRRRPVSPKRYRRMLN